MPATQPFTLEGKTAVVTGGAGWIGSALCEALGEVGARVYVVDINAAGVRTRVSALRESGFDARGRVADVMSDTSLRNTIDEIAQDSGRLDVLVNCAYSSPMAQIDDVGWEDMRKGFDAATAYFVGAQQAAIHMRRTGGGSIINIGSMYGEVTGYPDVYKDLMPANPLPYQASKAAVHHITRYLAVYWAGDRIRVNAIAPGPIPNPNAPHNSACSGYPEFVSRLAQRVPLHRIGTPQDLKGAVVFFASEGSGYVTGQTMFVDGGWTVW